MVNFEDILEDLENNGFTIISIQPDDDDPYSKYVIVEDSNGNKTTKHYVLSGYKEITDDNGNIIGVDEDWTEV